MTMTRGRRVRVQELLSGRDRNVSTAEMDSRSGPCVTIEILVSYTTQVRRSDANFGLIHDYRLAA